METTYYTLTAREILVEGAAVEQVSGGSGRRLVCVRAAGGAAARKEQRGKVIDLAAWQADREELPEEPQWEEETLRDEERPAPRHSAASRPRRSRSALGLELLASLSVTAVALVLLVQALL